MAKGDAAYNELINALRNMPSPAQPLIKLNGTAIMRKIQAELDSLTP